MEFVKDYVMRMINEMVRMVLKLLFSIDMEECEELIEQNDEQAEQYNILMGAEGKLL